MPTPDTNVALIREPLLRGRQLVAAVWLPSDWFDARVRAVRVLACWQPGASVLRFAGGDLLCYATALERDCVHLPGWPLCRQGHTLCSAPLSDRERATLPQADVWIVQGAAVVALVRSAALIVDASAWLAVHQLSLHDTYDCSMTLPAPVMLNPPARALREILHDAVPPASQERERFLAALASSAQDRHAARWWQRLLTRVLGGFSRLTGRVSALKPTAGAMDQVAPRSATARAPRWRRWLMRTALLAQLGGLLGRIHARHLQRMLSYFDEGNLEEALRHAIPLGSDVQGTLDQAFALPGRRTALELSAGGGPITGVGIGADLMEHLRQLYRRAFNKLDRAQRIDEAVFVLAELLNAKQEALDYLERHERFAQAAELALAWNMAPEVIVRLHCLAGQWQRAVTVARRDAAFANAVLQLEARWPDAAQRLREEWGQSLTQQGDWLGAVEAVWPAAALRELAAEWLQVAEAGGGQLQARALVQRAVLLPDTLERYAERLRELQRERSLSQDRAAMASALLSLGQVQPPRQLAASIVPAILADHAQGRGFLDTAKLQQLVRLTGDVLLQADLPGQRWPGITAAPLGPHSEPLCLSAPVSGAYAILDAVPLADERYLVALGEAGVRIVDAAGKVCAQFAVPAQALVIAHSQQVALALTRRESLWRVSRLNLVQRSSLDLGLAEFTHFATQFDGLNWTVAQGRQLRVLDTQRSLREVVWQVTDLPGVVIQLTSAAAREHMLIESADDSQQLWIYELPRRRLLTRDVLPKLQAAHMRLLNPGRDFIDVRLERTEGSLLCLNWPGVPGPVRVCLQCSDGAMEMQLCGEWLVVSLHGSQTEHSVLWLCLSTGAEHVRVSWPSASPPSMRAYGEQHLMFDAAGRILSFDVGSSVHHSCVLR